MTDKTGGPAFPTLGNVGHNSDWLSDDGMSLRDYFAAKATEEDIREFREAFVIKGDVVHRGLWGSVHEEKIAYRYTRTQAKYRYADAMLEARNVR